MFTASAGEARANMVGMTPRSLGKYRIYEEMGRGPIGTVYKALDPASGRQVAIKALTQRFGSDEELVRRFHQQAAAARELSHPNIVVIHGVDKEDDTHYVVMEYLEGQPLSQVINEHGPLPLSRAMKILGQISSALDYAHSLGFVHGDIKPTNIIIGPDDQATLTDFGIVKAVDGTSVSKEGAPIGTPEYMSPEQCQDKQADSRSDLYSLGVVLYEILTGQVPFTADTPAGVMYQQVRRKPVPPRRINSDLSEPMERVVLRALAKEPDQRYATAGTLAEALEAAIRGEEPPGLAKLVPDEKAVESLYMRALAAVEAERWQEAVELLNQVLLLDGEYRDARELLRRAKNELARQRKIAELKARGERLLKAGRAPEAIKVLRSALSLQPGNKELSDLLARAEREAEEDEAEKARLGQAEELHRQAKRFIRQEQWARAVESLREAITLAPENRELAFLLAQAEGNWRTQREIEDLLREGTEALRAEDWLQAIRRFEQVLLKGPSRADAREKLDEAQRGSELAKKYDTARKLMEEAEWAEAIKLFEEILDEEPGYKESQQLLDVARAAMYTPRVPEVQEAVETPATVAGVPPGDEPGLIFWQRLRSALGRPNAHVLMASSALLGFILCQFSYWLVVPRFGGLLAAMLPPGATSTTGPGLDSDLVPTYTHTATPSHTATSSPTATPTVTHSPTATSTPTATARPPTPTQVATPTLRPPTPVPPTPTPIARQAPPGMIYMPAGETRGGDGGVLTYGAHLIDDHAVTWGEYQKCVQDIYCSRITDVYVLVPTGRHAYELARIKDYMPVHRATWYDADRYCRWAGKRLPTLAEWRNACENASRWNRAVLWATGQLTLPEWVADPVVGTDERVLCLDGCYSTVGKSPLDAPGSNDALWNCLRGPDPAACSRGFRCARTVE